MLIIGVDTGGTFTDFIYKDGDAWKAHKRLSTPDNPARAVIEGLRHITGRQDLSGASGRADSASLSVTHGSTVATNAILERKGVVTALATNAGFEDVIEIGRQNRARLYDLAYRKEPHIVPASLRFGIEGRVDSKGRELTPLNLDQARAAAKTLREARVESVAVCFLFSFLRPEHENQMREILEAEGLSVSVSHEILAEFREFERTSTLAVNAYVSPKMTRYLRELKTALAGNTLRVMQSNGGSISADTAMVESVRTILSGPAGGAVGAFEIGRLAACERLITFDMGGTSTDVALLDHGLPLTLESSISGYPVKVPMIDIHTVGAGGGSIAALDAGGALTVGPESAGADPGPICYGKGERLTVTDAHLFLGRLVPEHFLGGEMRLETKTLNQAVESMARQAGITPTELAEGVLAIADANMERAIRVISVERGHDPREFTLFSFGGAGGLHCASLARLLGIPRVLIPKDPGILSAVGMVMADVIKDYSRTVMLTAEDVARATTEHGLEELFLPLEIQGAEDLRAEGFAYEAIASQRFLDMRYQGQSFEIIVPLGQTPGPNSPSQNSFGAASSDCVERFEALHEQKYGYRNSSKPVEIVNVRLRASGSADKPSFPVSHERTPDLPPAALLGIKEVIFNSAPHAAPVLDRNEILPGNAFQGPAIIVEYSSTIVVPPGARVEADGMLNLILHVEGA